MLRRSALLWAGEWRVDLERPPGRHPLCGPCQVWLAGILDEVRVGGGKPSSLYGSPTTNDRALLFDDQCNVCHALPSGYAAAIDCVSVSASPQSWAPLLVCGSCDAWIASLANDGRSARGRVDRGIDGPYGEWPHPNLRELSVEMEVVDQGARSTIFESCIAMEVPVRSGAQPASPAVLFIEASQGGDVSSLVRGSRASRPGVIVLAPLNGHDGLRKALEAGATGWLTVPLTPQQVTAALTGALRKGLRRAWDPETCLPIASLVDVARPTLVLEPEAGVTRFEVAWLAKRFCRGYDELAVAGGHIVLLPKVPADRLHQVRERLSGLLAGRCGIVAIESHHREGQRFDAAG